MLYNRQALMGALALVVGFSSITMAKAKDDQKPSATLEFRRAYLKPGKNLVKVKIKGSDQVIYMQEKAEITKQDVEKAKLGENNDSGPSVMITLTAKGGKKMAKISKEHMKKPLAIVVDGKVISAPTIYAEMSKNVVIAGQMTLDEARDLVDALNGKSPTKKQDQQ